MCGRRGRAVRGAPAAGWRPLGWSWGQRRGHGDDPFLVGNGGGILSLSSNCSWLVGRAWAAEALRPATTGTSRAGCCVVVPTTAMLLTPVPLGGGVPRLPDASPVQGPVALLFCFLFRSMASPGARRAAGAPPPGSANGDPRCCCSPPCNRVGSRGDEDPYVEDPAGRVAGRTPTGKAGGWNESACWMSPAPSVYKVCTVLCVASSVFPSSPMVSPTLCLFALPAGAYCSVSAVCPGLETRVRAVQGGRASGGRHACEALLPMVVLPPRQPMSASAKRKST